MTDTTPHLTASAAAQLAEPQAARIRAMRSRRWVLYPRAKQALGRLDALLEHPRGTRMPSIAIYGDSGMGKTMIMKQFRDQHPPSFDKSTGALTTPVLAMEMVSRPGERRFYGELLTLLGAPQSPRADITQMEQAALRIMEAIGVQVLVIDEVHNILAGTYREQRIVLNTLRFLSNRLQISLVCFGVNDAREAIGGDVQLARRFEQFTLNRWAANEDFETLVTSILRSQLQGWRITCPHCSRPFQDLAQCDLGRPFDQYRAAALRGEKLLEDDAERDIQTWTSPLALARLLLMRRVPWPFPRDAELWRYRVLGIVIPDLDDVIAREGSFPPSPKHPVVPLHIRPALLASVAIVERAGPEMLQMLQAHTFGHNRNRFIEETDHLINPAFGLPGPRQMQLI